MGDSNKMGKPKPPSESINVSTDKNTTKIISGTGDTNKLKQIDANKAIISSNGVPPDNLLKAENVKLMKVCVKVDRSPYKEWRKNCSDDVQSAIKNLFQTTRTENQIKGIINDSDITTETKKDAKMNTEGKVLRKSPRKDPHTRTWQSLQLSPPPVVPKSPQIIINHINSK